MKHITSLLIFVSLLVLELACTSNGELDPNTRQQVKAMRAGMNTLSTKTLVMIYDFNPETIRLEYRAVEVKNPTGNKLEDLITTFIEAQHFGHQAKDLRLKGVTKENNQTVLDFSGSAKFASSKYRSLFLNALEMTITRNTNLTDFLIENI